MNPHKHSVGQTKRETESPRWQHAMQRFEIVRTKAPVLLMGLLAVLLGILVGIHLRRSSLQDIYTLVGIVSGSGMIVWQLHRQHKDNLHLQMQNHKEKLKLRIHTQISEDVRFAMGKYKAVHVLINDIMRQYHNCLILQQSRGNASSKLYTSVTDLHNAHSEAIGSITRLMCRLEECEIVATNLKIFRVAFSSVIEIAGEAYGEFLRHVSPYLEVDIPKKRQEQLGIDATRTMSPTEEDLPAMEESYNYYSTALVECYCVISDLSRELQNILLEDLFNSRVPPREPADPNCIVVTTKPEEIQRLTDYFTRKDDTGLTQHQKDVLLRVKLLKEYQDGVPTD
jgi:hypothetical protein